jgi:Tfp pilus assembly protein PilZ
MGSFLFSFELSRHRSQKIAIARGIMFGHNRVMAKTNEKRNKTRIPLKGKVRHSEYQVLGTPVFHENAAIDLSGGGISFETSREYRVGNLVLLEVELEGEKLQLLVCVAWVKKTGSSSYQVGAELMALDPAHKARLNHHLDRMGQARPAKKKSSRKKVVRKKVARKKVATRKPQSRKRK